MSGDIDKSEEHLEIYRLYLTLDLKTHQEEENCEHQVIPALQKQTSAQKTHTMRSC